MRRDSVCWDQKLRFLTDPDGEEDSQSMREESSSSQELEPSQLLLYVCYQPVYSHLLLLKCNIS